MVELLLLVEEQYLHQEMDISIIFSHIQHSDGFVVSGADLTCEVLLVAGGGGGGGGYYTGGGGAGGILHATSTTVQKGTYSITIGQGGTGGTSNGNTDGTNGGDTVFNNITAIGGGFGPTGPGADNPGNSWWIQVVVEVDMIPLDLVVQFLNQHLLTMLHMEIMVVIGLVLEMVEVEQVLRGTKQQEVIRCSTPKRRKCRNSTCLDFATINSLVLSISSCHGSNWSYYGGGGGGGQPGVPDIQKSRLWWRWCPGCC